MQTLKTPIKKIEKSKENPKWKQIIRKYISPYMAKKQEQEQQLIQEEQKALLNAQNLLI